MLSTVLTSCSALCALEYRTVVELDSSELMLHFLWEFYPDIETLEVMCEDITSGAKGMINDFNRIQMVSPVLLTRSIIYTYLAFL